MPLSRQDEWFVPEFRSQGEEEKGKESQDQEESKKKDD